eukprot:gene16971-biopygen7199
MGWCDILRRGVRDVMRDMGACDIRRRGVHDEMRDMGGCDIRRRGARCNAWHGPGSPFVVGYEYLWPCPKEAANAAPVWEGKALGYLRGSHLRSGGIQRSPAEFAGKSSVRTAAESSLLRAAVLMHDEGGVDLNLPQLDRRLRGQGFGTSQVEDDYRG